MYSYAAKAHQMLAMGPGSLPGQATPQRRPVIHDPSSTLKRRRLQQDFLRTSRTLLKRSPSAKLLAGLQTAGPVKCTFTESLPHAMLSVTTLLHKSHSTTLTMSTFGIDVSRIVRFPVRHKPSCCAPTAPHILCTHATNTVLCRLKTN
jgi:hypothetical protein